MNDDIPGGDRPIPPPKAPAPKRTRNAASTAKVASTTPTAPLDASPLAAMPSPMDPVERDPATPDLFGHPDALAPDIRDRPAGEYHGQPYGGRTAEPRSWWDKTRDRLGAMLGDEEARRRLQGEPSPAPGTYDSRRDDTGWSDPVHPDAGRPHERP